MTNPNQQDAGRGSQEHRSNPRATTAADRAQKARDRAKKAPGSKTYDLEERTFEFAKAVRAFVKRLPWSPANEEDGRQVIKSSGSVGANYREANEALSKKDFAMRIRICRKEAKESRYWLRLLDVADDGDLAGRRQGLATEATELLKIFSAILNRSR
ncbi:MAG: four helix bundle protein [Planctomycetota bacterium]